MTFRRFEVDGSTVSVWVGGPCVYTGQLCPVWEVRRVDGTGFQTRGPNAGPDVHQHPERRRAIEALMLDEARAMALTWLQTREGS